MVEKEKYGASGKIEASVLGAYSFLPFAKAKTWLTAYFRPEAVIKAESGSFSIGSAAADFALIGFLVGVMSGLIALTGLSLLGGGIGLPGGLITLVAMAVFYAIIYPIAWLIGSGIYYIIAKLLGGKGSYTAQTSSLALVLGGSILLGLPLQLFGIIPFVGWIFGLASLLVGLYALYSYYRMLKHVHGFSTGRALAVFILPAIIIVGLLALLALAIAAIAALGIFTLAGAGIMGYS